MTITPSFSAVVPFTPGATFRRNRAGGCGEKSEGGAALGSGTHMRCPRPRERLRAALTDAGREGSGGSQRL